MCTREVSQKILEIVNTLVGNDGVASFDAMSVLNRMPPGMSHHKEINIELTTLHHAGEMRDDVICVSRPVPKSNPPVYHRVYVKTRLPHSPVINFMGDDFVCSAALRDKRIKEYLERHNVGVSSTEAARRIIEAVIFGGFEPII